MCQNSVQVYSNLLCAQLLVGNVSSIHSDTVQCNVLKHVLKIELLQSEIQTHLMKLVSKDVNKVKMCEVMAGQEFAHNTKTLTADQNNMIISIHCLLIV